MKKHSLWEDIQEPIQVNSTFNTDVDILIIGGGITGLTTAYFLKDSGKKILLIDKGKLVSGITAKTTAKITYLQGAVYQELMQRFNKQVAKQYYDSQKEAINLLTEIVEKNKIDCDLVATDAITFTLEEANIDKIKAEEKLLNEWKEEVRPVEYEEIQYGILGKNSYTFHPLKYLNGLIKTFENKINIAENVLTTQISEENGSYVITTSRGKIKTKVVVVACHYPFFLLPSMIPLKTYIKREYVNAARIENSQKMMAINIDSSLQSIRYYKDYLIYGALDHKLTSRIHYQQNYEDSQKQFAAYFQKEPEYTWMNQDIMSHDGLPFIGQIKENMFLATAYNAWGMTNGTIAAKIMSDEINGEKSPYHYLFSPKRSNISLYLNSLVGSFSYLKVYTQALWKKSLPLFIKQDGISYGVYQDKEGITHRIKLICPHMKCHLVFNQEEETWDCPCHGSRFDLDGNLLEGPAKEELKNEQF